MLVLSIPVGPRNKEELTISQVRLMSSAHSLYVQAFFRYAVRERKEPLAESLHVNGGWRHGQEQRLHPYD